MDISILNTTPLRRYIPNIIAEVDGEPSLSERLDPFIYSAKLWLEHYYLGTENFLSDAHNELAIKIVVAKAFASAIPSLDVVVTPTGFGIISTSEMAPASKERIERLIESLNSYVEANIAVLVDICCQYEQWRTSPLGEYFCSTLFRPSDIASLPANKKVSFEELQPQALQLEQFIANEYLGSSLMNQLRSDYHSGNGSHVIDLLRAAELSSISQNSRVPGHQKLYSIIYEVKQNPRYKLLWEADMGESFNRAAFKNDIKGGFYF